MQDLIVLRADDVDAGVGHADRRVGRFRHADVDDADRFVSRRPIAAMRRNGDGCGRASKPSTTSSMYGRFSAGSIDEKPATPPVPGPRRWTSGPIALGCGTPAVGRVPAVDVRGRRGRIAVGEIAQRQPMAVAAVSAEGAELPEIEQAQWKPARGSRLRQLIVPSCASAPIRRWFRSAAPPLSVTRGDDREACRRRTPRTIARASRDGSIGSVKSQTRAGMPLSSSPTRPVNADCTRRRAADRSTPASRCGAPLRRARFEARAERPGPVGADRRDRAATGPGRRAAARSTTDAAARRDRWAVRRACRRRTRAAPASPSAQLVLPGRLQRAAAVCCWPAVGLVERDVVRHRIARCAGPSRSARISSPARGRAGRD